MSARTHMHKDWRPSYTYMYLHRSLHWNQAYSQPPYGAHVWSGQKGVVTTHRGLQTTAISAGSSSQCPWGPPITCPATPLRGPQLLATCSCSKDRRPRPSCTFHNPRVRGERPPSRIPRRGASRCLPAPRQRRERGTAAGGPTGAGRPSQQPAPHAGRPPDRRNKPLGAQERPGFPPGVNPTCQGQRVRRRRAAGLAAAAGEEGAEGAGWRHAPWSSRDFRRRLRWRLERPVRACLPHVD